MLIKLNKSIFWTDVYSLAKKIMLRSLIFRLITLFIKYLSKLLTSVHLCAKLVYIKYGVIESLKKRNPTERLT